MAESRGNRVKISGLRTDIQGLRAIAVSLVLFFHLWPNRLGGGYVGVDVFFVISGFLITLHLLSRPPASGHDLATFWSRRVKRLLPASFLVLSCTLIASRLVAPATQWQNTAIETITSALYVQNWRLANSSVDYLAADNAPSPVQHFWSLSVEEQFYLVWPVLILVLAWITHKRGWSLMATIGAGLSVLVLSSLAYSIYATALEPASAYFITPTRMWELGIGGLLAVLVFRDRVTLSPRVGSAVAWAGVVAIAVTALVYTSATPFPGWQALLPVMGAAAVIFGRPEQGTLGRLLALRPVQRLGDISYSVYLWHWPLIILVPNVNGGHLGRLDKAFIIVLTLALSSATKRFVEDPVRASNKRFTLPRTYRFAAVGMVVVVAISAIQLFEVDRYQAQAAEQLEQALSGDNPCFGAASLAPGSNCVPTKKGPVVPSAAEAANDKSDAYTDNCWEYPPFTGTKTCTYSDEESDVSIALVGNSHAGHWLPALQELAKTYRWKITTYIASECTLSTSAMEWNTDEKRRNCLAWSQRVLERTQGKQFDLVITAERNSEPAKGETLATSYDTWEAGYLGFLKLWEASATPVLILRDNPLPGASMGSVPDCVAENEDDLRVCSGAKEVWLTPDPLVDAAKELNSGSIAVADLTRYFCIGDRCPGVIGGVIVYFDRSHLTKTYGRTLAPYLYDPILTALNR